MLIGHQANVEFKRYLAGDRGKKDMNDYAIAFVKLLNKLCEAQGVPTLSMAQGTLLAVLLRELELPERRKTAEEIMAAADRAITMRPLY
jgi:hypothetical protein